MKCDTNKRRSGQFRLTYISCCVKVSVKEPSRISKTVCIKRNFKSFLQKKLKFYADSFRKLHIYVNFMVAPCINNIRHFIVQLMHTNYKILRFLK